MKAVIIEFPGSNCVDETRDALIFSGFDVEIIKHYDEISNDSNLVVLPGGFSWGDYISCGRLAKFSQAVISLKEKIKQRNCFTLGICNGFQILCEAKILPGALLENQNSKFICADSELIFKNQKFSLPIAHHQGRYYIDDIKKLADFELIKYKNNPNGSSCDIAGIFDKKKYILGLMPHPERNLVTPFKNKNGKIIFDFVREKLDEII